MTDNNVHINQISHRYFILSPAVQSGIDKESSSQDFFQENSEPPNLGRLGLGMKVFHRKTHVQYTIINFEKGKVIKLNLQEKINSTLDFMYKTSHPYLFRLLNHYETEGHVFLIFEPYDGDSLDHIIEQGKCDLQTALKYFVEILLAVQHLHNNGFNNINLCPENILIGECVKLTDYGIKMTGKNEMPKRDIRRFIKDGNSYAVNAYHTPEEIMGIINDETPYHGSKTDSWNLGILLFEMLTNFKSPFKGDTDKEYINSLLNGEIDLSLIDDEFCKELISKLTKANYKDRIDVDDILNMEYIKNINIEQPEIDPSDNIINPEEEVNENENDGDDDNDNEDKNEIIKRLKEENEYLKKALELRQEEKGEETNNISKIKTLDSININNNGGIEPKESKKNILKLVEEINEKDKNDNDKSVSSSSDKNEFENLSESSDDLNNENFYIRCEKYKEKYLNAKKTIKKLEKKNKSLNDELAQLKKEKKKIEEQKTLNILNNFEKLNTSKISNINELSEIVINSVNLFKESQQNLGTLIDKIIAISAEEHISLIEENKKYIDNKGKIFFDTLENINISGNKQTEIEMNKEKEERKKLDKKKDAEIADLKKKYELSKQKENILKDKIKVLEERNKSYIELNKNLEKTINTMFPNYKHQ